MSYKILFQKVYDMVKWVYPTVSKFPRNHRAVLSQRIEITSIRILEMVIDFAEKDTKSNRKKILNDIHKLQILLRFCKDLSILKFRQYEYSSSLLTEISELVKVETENSKRGGVGNGLHKFVQ
ncbi:MAG: four helix bundle protein [Candidatus Aenigmarchaeota archaeon]|nr:four helix bundle protein [Candidatus Aenigmarchaeota archaeon]